MELDGKQFQLHNHEEEGGFPLSVSLKMAGAGYQVNI